MTLKFTTEKLTERVFRLHLPGNVFAYLVKGDERAALIDTGLGLGSLKEYIENELCGMPYIVLLTHGHLDHAGGAAEFDEVFINEKDKEIAQNTTKQSRAGYLRREGESGFADEDLLPAKSDGFVTYGEEQSFNLGGETLKILPLGGHTAGSVCVLIQNERILLSGDGCCSLTIMVDKNGVPLSEYKKQLKAVIDSCEGRVDSLLFSHPHNFGGIDVLQDMADTVDAVLSHTDDHFLRAQFGNYIAFKTTDDSYLHRADGRSANLVYVDDVVR